MNIETILFDLDGTLVDSVTVNGEILNEMRYARGKPAINFSHYRKLISKGAAELVGLALDFSDEPIALLVAEFRDRYFSTSTPEHLIFPEVKETLNALYTSGCRLAICSNKPERLCQKVLIDTNLDRYFYAVIGGDTAVRPKPSRAPIDHALKSLRSCAAKSVLVGDSTVDQQAALAAELRFVFFAGGYNDGVIEKDSWAVITTMGDLLGLSQSLPILSHVANR